jgi:hypothetical protein
MTHVKNFAGSLSLICGSLFLQAQVAVRFEPRHKVALENEWVRLLDVRLAPGDTSLLHIHEIPSYFIPLSSTAIGTEVKGQSPQESKFTVGATWYNGFENGPLIHKVWNADSSVLHVIDLELLSNKKTTLPSLELNNANIDYENERLRVYKIQITNNRSITLSSLKTPMIIISLSGPEISVQNANKKDIYHVKAGGFQWLEAGGSFLINNNENVAAAALLIWLK